MIPISPGSPAAPWEGFCTQRGLTPCQDTQVRLKSFGWASLKDRAAFPSSFPCMNALHRLVLSEEDTRAREENW